MNSLPQGTILQGPKNRYQIQKALGQGTFGITYLASTEMQVVGQMGSFSTKVQVAVKEFFMRDFSGREGTEVTSSSQGSYFTDYKKKFLREAENLAKLQHPHIVKVLEYFEANGTAYYAMEYVEGGSLEIYLEKKGTLKESEALLIARQIGDALEAMHAHQMLHLDLKPANVMLRSTGEAVLIDFGLSKQFDKQGAPESSTSIGGGTPGYAPIEQANYQRGDGLPVTMDVYAFGATIYKMLTGERPPEASEVLNDGFPAFVLEKHGVSTSTIAVIEKAMTPMRKKRFQSVREVLEALTLYEKQAVRNETEQDAPIANSESASIAVTDAASEETTYTPRQTSPSRTRQQSSQPFWKPIASFVSKNTRWLLGFLLLTAIAAVAVMVINLSMHSCSSSTKSDAVFADSIAVADSLSTIAAEMQKPYTEDSLGNRTFQVNGVSFKMIRVEAGTFDMGEKVYDIDAKPVHKVTLTDDFYIGETEVTQALWQAVMGSNPSHFKGEDLPVETISWDDCQDFIQKLNDLTGSSFILPSEAQWEFAARGGNKSKGYQYCGSNKHTEVGWTQSTGSTKTHPVGTKIPNELGLYDMGGNVYELCLDWYAHYPSGTQTNPTGPVQGESHVARGGSYLELGFLTMPSCRYTHAKYRDQGLRLALPAND
ncbi:MAG: SUMF1/EgtB/PvdO family nonheme iron enzyme [Bacteroidaceae bacterium]|nr:SUMF1/EgtB/PvdO family nonheme iron enzyme [Bacteroidaceae bacterium]